MVHYDINLNRGWYWLCCNELGFFQTVDSPLVASNMTGENVIPINWYTKQRAQIFDPRIDNATVYSNIDATNARYKGQNG